MDKNKLLFTAIPTSLDEGFDMRITLPKVEFSVIQADLTQNDYLYSQALRFIPNYKEVTQEALWMLFETPNPSLFKDLLRFLQSSIAKDVMKSNARAVADYDMVMGEDYLLVDKEVADIPAKVAVVLNEMRHENFSVLDIPYMVTHADEVNQHYSQHFIRNQTWMNVSLVESLISALQHEHFKNNNKMDVYAMMTMMKREKPINMAEVDFAMERLIVEYDYTKILSATFRGGNDKMVTKLRNLCNESAFNYTRVDREGYPLRVHKVEPLVSFIKECEAGSSTLRNIFFYYLYPEVVAEAFRFYVSLSLDEDYENYGAPSLETWISAASFGKTRNLEALDAKHFGIEVAAGSREYTQSIRKYIDDTLSEDPFVVENGVVVGTPIPARGYVLKAHAAYARPLASIAREVMEHKDETEGRPAEMSEQLYQAVCTNTAMLIHTTAKVAAYGEFCRIKRALLSGQFDDDKTNEMSNLFPNQYSYFYDAHIFGSVLPETYAGSAEVFYNSMFMLNSLKQGRPRPKYEAQEVFLVSTLLEKADTNPNSIILCDLHNNPYSMHTDDLPCKYPKTWSTPILASYEYIEDALRSFYMLMGDENSNPHHNKTSLTSVVRMPLFLTPEILSLLGLIYQHPHYNVAIHLPKKMHDPFFDLTIVRSPFHLKMDDKVALESSRRRKTKLREGFYTYFYYVLAHVLTGMVNRNYIWELIQNGMIINWVSERYKHLQKMNFTFELKAGVLVKKNIMMIKKVPGRTSGEKSKIAKRNARRKIIEESQVMRDRYLSGRGPIMVSLRGTTASSALKKQKN